ncbi:exopolysaccharide biosynthesis polyprenyl glycosylphosphotransferase [Streptomyces litchfieldiae]|uniref:Exopolysaccharide biosynthesis polyprenyl glycosylphosphotransferase n=1 Tax=Streptomyces litchfieldiae TaxID=3075543 RepID=A0ABU2MT48_9ACTN|nr:exopolysaccharide biosynthesis polyprenyl glycosylphosphotransferase [Streptomyces sp. DSM 44938]MDT0344577.1 exopolysaccharide biosynthesis polyprenyl glycosylphosphotransferase [Streptomyces sp. DSM 44938]
MRHSHVSRHGSARRSPGTGRRSVRRRDTASWYPLAAIAADLLGVLVPVLTVYAAAGEPRPFAAAVAATLAWITVRALNQRYVGRSLGESRGLIATVHDWLVLVGLLAALRAITGESSEVSSALLALAPAVPVTGLTCVLIHRHLTGQRHQAQALRRVLLVGEAGPVDVVAAQLAARTDHAYVVVGTVLAGTGEPACGIPESGRLDAVGPDLSPAVPDLVPDGLDGSTVLAAARRKDADLVLVVPGSLLTGERLRRLSWAVQDAGLSLAIASGLTEVALRRLSVSTAAGLNLLHIAAPLRRGAQPAFKSVFDRAAAGLALVALAPLLALLAVAVRLDSPGPVLYRQTRIGHRGTPFTLWKFRTMVADAELRRPELESANEHLTGPLFKMRSDPRVTRLGRLLRRTSLDELPQLFNVVRGQMSLVGPRPPLPEEVARYGAVELRRLGVKPGLTGPWQISGRSDLSWDEGLALDLFYTDNWSVTGDLDVLARTFRAVVDGRGAY